MNSDTNDTDDRKRCRQEGVRTAPCPACVNPMMTDETLPFEPVRRLYHGMHDSAWLYRCRVCERPFLKYFDEWRAIAADWNDDFWIFWIPLTPEEVALLEGHVSTNIHDRVVMEMVIALQNTHLQLVRYPEGGYRWEKSTVSALSGS